MRRLAAPALLLALACDTGFDPQYRVSDLRILGVRAQVVGSTSADASAADTLQLEALVANPLGRTGLAVRWFVCAPAGSAVLPCLEPELLKDPDRLAAQPGVFELPPGAGTGERPPEIALGSLPPEARQALDAALQAARDLAAGTPTYLCRMYVEVPVVAVASAEGLTQVAVKRVRVVPPPPYEEPFDAYLPNRNPVAEDVRRGPTNPDGCLGGASLVPAGFPAGRTVLCGVGDAPGSFTVCGPGGPQATAYEQQSWQWFTDHGTFPEFDDGVGNATGKHVDFDRPAGAFTLWVILRDGRGGESWWSAQVEAAPAP